MPRVHIATSLKNGVVFSPAPAGVKVVKAMQGGNTPRAREEDGVEPRYLVLCCAYNSARIAPHEISTTSRMHYAARAGALADKTFGRMQI